MMMVAAAGAHAAGAGAKVSVSDGNALKAATAARHVVPTLQRQPERANSREHKIRDHDCVFSGHVLVDQPGREGARTTMTPLVRFILVNVVFVAIFIALAVYGTSLWGWAAFVAVWCIADYYFAHGVALTWKHWALLLAILTVIDVVVLYATGQI